MAKTTENVDDLATKGRWPSFIKLFAVIGVTSGIGEVIGKITIPVGIGSVIILPMVFAMILALLLTPDALGRRIEGLKNICGREEVDLSGSLMMVILLILGVKLGAAAGPNLPKLIAAGPALILQEFGIWEPSSLAFPWRFCWAWAERASGQPSASAVRIPWALSASGTACPPRREWEPWEPTWWATCSALFSLAFWQALA